MIRHNFSLLMTLTQIENMMLINRTMPTYQFKKIKIILISIMEICYNKLNISFKLNLIKLSFQIYFVNPKTTMVENQFQ
jgi:hypothetical protein